MTLQLPGPRIFVFGIHGGDKYKGAWDGKPMCGRRLTDVNGYTCFEKGGGGVGGGGEGSEMETNDVFLVKDVIYTHRLCLCNVRINVQVTLMRGLEEKGFVGGAIMYVCGGRGTTMHVCVFHVQALLRNTCPCSCGED